MALRGPNSVPWGTDILKHLRQILAHPLLGGRSHEDRAIVTFAG
jgi:hypothetical protein